MYIGGLSVSGFCSAIFAEIETNVEGSISPRAAEVDASKKIWT